MPLTVDLVPEEPFTVLWKLHKKSLHGCPTSQKRHIKLLSPVANNTLSIEKPFNFLYQYLETLSD